MRLLRYYLFAACGFSCVLLHAQQPVKPEGFKLFFEKTYLHTDRERYTAGEDIWFKAYLVDGQTNQLTGSSNNLYAELIDPGSKITERKVIRLDGGLGQGDFRLKDSIIPGIYRLRAYTNWMRNFGDHFIFEKYIQVYSEPARTKSKIITDSRYKSVNRKFADQSPAFSTKPQQTATLSFFPEGGSMIEGVAGIVAFKATDTLDNGIGFSASIENSKGETMTSIATATGTGSFMFIPLPGEKYTVRGTYSNENLLSAELPPALFKGFSMFVRDTGPALLVIISTNQATFDEMKGKELLITGKSKGRPCYAARTPLKEMQTTMEILKGRFPEGIAALALYDYSGRPQAERLVYITLPGQEKARLEITTDKPVYAPKEQVNVLIKATEGDLPAQASLSVAVVDADAASESQDNIVSYLNLVSEVRGKIEHPLQYFDSRNASRSKQLDLLLLTQGWRDYSWKRLADSALRVNYAAEQGMSVSGRVRQKWANKPITGSNITLTAFKAKGNKLFSTRTDSAGRFYFDRVLLYGQQLVRISSRSGKGKAEGILLTDSVFIKSPAVNSPSIRSLATADEKDSAGKSIEQKLLRKKYSLSDTIALKEVVIKQKNFRKTQLSFDQVTVNDKFRQSYHTVIEFLLAEIDYIGIMPDNPTKLVLSLGVEGGSPTPAIFVLKGKNIGARPESREDYYYLPMDKVEKIEVERVGTASGTEGFVYLTVKPDAFETDISVQYFNVNGYYSARTFYAPKYENHSGKQDLRTTIHWEPGLTTNLNGEARVSYYNADPGSRIQIRVEGITSKGEPIAGTAVYEVK